MSELHEAIDRPSVEELREALRALRKCAESESFNYAHGDLIGTRNAGREADEHQAVLLAVLDELAALREEAEQHRATHRQLTKDWAALRIDRDTLRAEVERKTRALEDMTPEHHFGTTPDDLECSEDCGPRDPETNCCDDHRPDIGEDRCDKEDECYRCLALAALTPSAEGTS